MAEEIHKKILASIKELRASGVRLPKGKINSLKEANPELDKLLDNYDSDVSKSRVLNLDLLTK